MATFLSWRLSPPGKSHQTSLTIPSSQPLCSPREPSQGRVGLPASACAFLKGLPMADQWYYARGGDKLGPFSARQLKDLADGGRILPTDTVWKQGIERGVSAARVKNLFPLAPASFPEDVSAAPSPAPSPLLPPTEAQGGIPLVERRAETPPGELPS